MTTMEESVFDSGLVDALIKNEPQDLTGYRGRTGSTELEGGRLVKLVGGEQGEDQVTLDISESLGFPGSYDSPGFYPGEQERLYPGERYGEQEVYPGEPGYRGSYSTFPSTDLPSPDSGIGEQITPRGLMESDASFDFSKDSYSNQLLSESTVRKDADTVDISKVFSPYGFHYTLDAPSSSSVRREDDKVTYMNKGQFYGVTLDYSPDPAVHLKSHTVKSVIMLVFRERKSDEEELLAWQFWHSRQHSVKQRIMDVDTKNSLGLVGHIEELSHNALAVYWNPLESPAKVNLAVQCLSTDFSTQKGVKGLPLHVQIDTFDDPRADIMEPPTHRGYCQVKIFCDKGAERKLRDEERRAAKRRTTLSGKRRMEKMFHEAFDRSEFYSMSDLSQPAVLFSPPEDMERSSPLSRDFPYTSHRPIELSQTSTHGEVHPALVPESKRPRFVPCSSERIMIYVRQETEDVYTPLHLVPPSVRGLIASIENKYKIQSSNIRYLYRKNRDGIIAKIDDDMLRHYCNEDVFLMQVMVTEGAGGGEAAMVYDITLSEIQ